MTLNSENAVSIRGLRKVYNGRGKRPPKRALSGIDLDVPRGMIFGLLGPNGAGKSTLINILAGLVIKTAGAARIWGFDITENPRQSRVSIGVVPQELNLDSFFTPFELLELQAGLYGVPRKKRRTQELLEAIELADYADAYPRTLSGGLQRRLLIAKAMVHSPPILVLDEPTAGVDVELRQHLWSYIQALNETGVTIVLTTHYLEEAQALCDRIAIINHGQLIICEDTGDLLKRGGRKTLLIRPAEPLTACPDNLGDYKPELCPDGRLSLVYSPEQERLDDILARVRAGGITIADVDTETTKLENIFFGNDAAGRTGCVSVYISVFI